MKILLVDNGSNLLAKLKQLIPGEEVTQKSENLKSSDIKDFDVIILSGGNHSAVFEEAEFSEEIKTIQSGKAFIGICFGCELIVRAFGGELIELPEKQKGIYDIKVLDKTLGAENIKVYEGHRWAISKLPEQFELLATSERGPEIIKHKTFPIYGLQFHPENFVDETQGDELFLKILSKL